MASDVGAHLPILERLHDYPIPHGWPGNLFLLPEAAMSDLHRHVVDHRARRCLELGTGFGATACVLADALRQVNGHPLTTIDRYQMEPVGVDSVAAFAGVADWIEVRVDRLGYDWLLADMLAEANPPRFDLCLLDGAHEWVPDGLALTLVAELMAPGGWLVLDDLNFRLRDVPTWPETHAHLSDRELDAYQMAMVFDLLLRRRPDFTSFRVTHNGRIGWARKRRVFRLALGF